MAQGNPNPNPAGRFKKGQSANPGGRPKLPEHLRAINEFDGLELKRLISKYFRMTRVELHDAMQDAKTSMIEINIGSALAVGAKTGDLTKLNYLLDRVVGKVATQQTVTITPNPAESVSTDDLLKALKYE